jgi:hypothetical protein
MICFEPRYILPTILNLLITLSYPTYSLFRLNIVNAILINISLFKIVKMSI